jgi:hypothetical protein
MMMNMTQEELYNAQQDYQRFRHIMETHEILTQEEYEFCKAWDAEEAWKYLSNIGPAWKDGGFNGGDRYLNSNVYSEADKEAFDLRKEIGL